MKICPIGHTGKKLPHHHTSYFGLSILLLMVGFGLGASTLSASAVTQTKSGNIQVTANVASNVPVVPPSILSPSGGQTIVSTPITISGECTTGLLVEIHKNGYLAGSVRCDNNGSYTLKADLLLGENRLIANQTNGVTIGPNSNIVVVTYRPNIAIRIKPADQLILQSTITQQAGSIGEKISWQVQILGGTAPYAISWDWGDGTIDLKSADKIGIYSSDHAYTETGSHQVKITATDSTGQTAYLQLSEFTPTQATFSPTRPHDLPGTFLSIWPLYFMAVVLVWTFYIGERYGEIHKQKEVHLH